MLTFRKQYRIELAKTLSAHWYHVWRIEADGSETKLGVFPSSTTFLNAYPQSEQLTQWIAENGWQESQRIKSDAGKAGTRIHTACDLLEEGKTLDEDAYALEEWFKIKTFVDFHHQYNPELIAKEIQVFSETHGYAGRLDRIYKIMGAYTVLDFKSSRNFHKHFPLQFSSYATAIEEMADIEIAQTAMLKLGDQRNKEGYKFAIYPDWRDHFKVFLHVKATWEYDYEHPDRPPVIDVPSTLKL